MQSIGTDMDNEFWLKIVTVGLGLLGSAKAMHDWSNSRKSKLREEYKFAQEFLRVVEAGTAVHPYVREKGYQAIAGDRDISADEVDYLLSLNRPDRTLRDYVSAKKYLEHLPRSGYFQVQFKAKYRKRWSRQWRLTMFLTLYMLCVFAALAPFLLQSYLRFSVQGSFLTLAATLAVFGPYAWFFLSSGVNLARASKLVAHQDKHTPRVMSA